MDQRLIRLAGQERGASNWLTALPITDFGFTLLGEILWMLYVLGIWMETILST